jgi:hypothetical protein
METKIFAGTDGVVGNDDQTRRHQRPWLLTLIWCIGVRQHYLKGKRELECPTLILTLCLLVLYVLRIMTAQGHCTTVQNPYVKNPINYEVHMTYVLKYCI